MPHEHHEAPALIRLEEVPEPPKSEQARAEAVLRRLAKQETSEAHERRDYQREIAANKDGGVRTLPPLPAPGSSTAVSRAAASLPVAAPRQPVATSPSPSPASAVTARPAPPKQPKR